MPVEFLTDEQAAGYAAFRGAPSSTEMKRFFFLDDADLELIEPKRRAHNRLGFAVLLTSARYLGVVLDDPTEAPAEVVDYLAEQLDVADASVLKAYGERENTRLVHVRQLRRVGGYTDFAQAEAELRGWVDARAWTTGEGPKALFDASVGWLRERRVLLPGVTNPGPAGRLGAGCGEPAAVGHAVRAAGDHVRAGRHRQRGDHPTEGGDADGFCVLEQFHRMLRRREIYAKNSSKWGDPRAKLLDGAAWEQTKPTVLTSLGLPADGGEHLAARAARLHGTYREVAERVPANAQIVFGDDGRLHFAALEPEPEPESLLALRDAANAMLPRVDLPEALLEVFSWTGADTAFTSITGGEARLKDLNVTIAALLVAHACNVGYTPVISAAEALKYDRLSHVDQTYLRLETYRAANAALIDYQASIGLAQAWGGGLVASIDGMRFVVPVPSVYARPNPKYFGRRGGATWLNMLNDQAAGLGGKVVAGTPRDSLYVLDVLYDRDGGRRPQTIVTDTGSYSDIVFGLLTLAGYSYAPQLADLPDQKLWRTHKTADYGPFNDVARGRINLAKIERHWEDILRIIGFIHTGAVRAHDVIRMLSRDGSPTQLGDAIAHYGRISKSLHILRLADEPDHRRQIKTQANLQEGRHDLARKIFHGRRGQLYQRYQDGMEDQIGALGLVLNALVLFTTRYMDAAITKLRADGFDVRDEDVARLSPFVRHHVNVLGRYSFNLPELPGGLRPLREKDAVDDE